MKKLIFLLTALFLGAVLCGCTVAPPLSSPVTQTERKDVSAMTDNEVYDALIDKYFMNLDYEAVPEMSDVQITVLVGLTLDAEVNNGGLCQFFINYPEYVPAVPDCLELLGAYDTKEAYEGYIRDYDIDLNALGGEVSVEAFLEFYEKYPSDDFDEKYYEGEVYRKLIEFGREHWEELF